MPRFRRRRGRAKQGIVSWVTSLIAILIGLWPVWYNLREILFGGRPVAFAAQELNQYYNPLAGNPDALKAGYGGLIGGLVFKVVTSELSRRARIRSVIPALRA